MRALIFFLLLAQGQFCLGNNSAVIRVDGSTAETTRLSIQKIEKSLSKNERKLFEKAILRIRIYNPNAAYDATLKGPNVLIDDDLLGKRINGMTYIEIMQLGEGKK